MVIKVLPKKKMQTQIDIIDTVIYFCFGVMVTKRRKRWVFHTCLCKILISSILAAHLAHSFIIKSSLSGTVFSSSTPSSLEEKSLINLNYIIRGNVHFGKGNQLTVEAL